MTRYTARALVALLSITLAALPALAQSAGERDAMAAMQEAATPGPMHEFWASLAGTWHVRTRMWVQPGAEPVTSEATAETRMILGGRYMQENFTGETPMGPFHGMSLTAYDNATRKVTAIWIDDMSTGMTVLTGKGCRPGNPLELSGLYDDPVTGQTIRIRTVTTYKDADHHHFDYYMQYPGQEEFLSLAMEYERVK